MFKYKCCVCEKALNLDDMNILSLPFKGLTPGRGWGCVVCNLPAEGAMASLCDPCFANYRAGRVEIRFIMAGDSSSELAPMPPEAERISWKHAEWHRR